MAYSDFALEAVACVLGVITHPADLFANDIEGGLGQCLARMVAADQFNQAANWPDTPIFGCVTTGEAWQFLRLRGTEALMDRQRYYIDNVGIILGIIQTIAAIEAGPAP